MIEPVKAGEVDRQVGGSAIKLGTHLNRIIDAVNRLQAEVADLRVRVEALKVGEEDDDA